MSHADEIWPDPKSKTKTLNPALNLVAKVSKLGMKPIPGPPSYGDILWLYWGYIGGISGIYCGYIGDILWLYWGYIVVFFCRVLGTHRVYGLLAGHSSVVSFGIVFNFHYSIAL